MLHNGLNTIPSYARHCIAVPLDFIDPDPMLDLAALEEESSAISDLNHYSCTSYEY